MPMCAFLGMLCQNRHAQQDNQATHTSHGDRLQPISGMLVANADDRQGLHWLALHDKQTDNDDIIASV